nr:uncharacterized protein LOC111506320 [Leptinotarsa decemlineata]
MIYMQIFKGNYPNVQETSFVGIGQPVTIIIFLIDSSGSYNVHVDDCWAHDNPNLDFSGHKLSLTKRSKGKKKIMNEWKKFKSPVEHKTLLYSNFTSFRFPEKEEIFFSCNVEIDRSLGSEIRYLWEPHYRLPNTELRYGSHIVR